jgi:hypothetical protein
VAEEVVAEEVVAEEVVAEALKIIKDQIAVAPEKDQGAQENIK